MDTLAPEYDGQPVIFIEYNVDSTDQQFLARKRRWWDAYQVGGSVSLPLVMVDSGNQFSNGVQTIDVYRNMVDTSLARPPQAAIEALWWRVGDSVRFSVEVKNLSGVTLSSTNRATVWGIVYEDTHVVNTDHYVRVVASTAVSSLAPGATGTFTLQTAVWPGGTGPRCATWCWWITGPIRPSGPTIRCKPSLRSRHRRSPCSRIPSR